jgi:hypothetical protein
VSPLEQIIRLLTETPCQHCGRSPYRSDRPVPLAALPTDPLDGAAFGDLPRNVDLDGAAGRDFPVRAFATTGFPGPSGPVGDVPGAGVAQDAIEAIDEDERWLWELVEEADRVRAAAPDEPTGDELPAARKALTAALGVQRRVTELNALTWAALNRPSSWLRPRHRIRLARALRHQQEAAAAAAAQVDRTRLALSALERRREHRQSYLARHRETLELGSNAQAELDRRMDELIDRYARMSDPPAWFRYGLGYPRGPEEYPDWLRRARDAIAQRRRHSGPH